ncbi:hypothetical protein [Tsukamurella pseudospumae]|uniref:hypothetical protein n=1 Tax=Tsukamurella pseudospumae TaxID=239498 RepID=UPI000AA58F29|nr:hypothetical protein [Tsukamurella pseudospumae]
MRPRSCPGCGRDRGRCPLQRARGCVSVDGASATQVAGSFPLLDEAVGVTESMVATLAHEGRYDRPTRCGEPFTVTPGRIALRFAPDRVVGALTDDDTPGGPADASMVGLTDRRGAALHRAFVTGESDRMIVRALGHLAPSDPHRALYFGTEPEPPPSQSPVGATASIDAILTGGRERLRSLCAEGNERYCQITPDWVPRIFEFLCDSGLPVDLAVAFEGMAQACRGEIHAALREGPRLLTGFADAAVDIDLARVEGCAVVRSSGPAGSVSAIELYDAGGSCSAMLTQFGPVDPGVRGEWEAMAQSLCESAV